MKRGQRSKRNLLLAHLASQHRLYELIQLRLIYILVLISIQVERAVCFWANLKVSAKTADQPAIKPFNKRGKGKSKMATSEPDSQCLNDPPAEANASGDTTNKEEDNFGWIPEFKADLWRTSTKDWVDGALRRGFDSKAIMQPLIDAAMKISTQGSLKSTVHRSRLEDVRPTIGPSSQSRREILGGIVSDSE